ncbi:hypothetical protein [Actinoplanes sp. TFC3]|nr:hypothetical protein [Actinoplanes sp. TFC3]
MRGGRLAPTRLFTVLSRFFDFGSAPSDKLEVLVDVRQGWA